MLADEQPTELGVIRSLPTRSSSSRAVRIAVGVGISATPLDTVASAAFATVPAGVRTLSARALVRSQIDAGTSAVGPLAAIGQTRTSIADLTLLDGAGIVAVPRATRLV